MMLEKSVHSSIVKPLPVSPPLILGTKKGMGAYVVCRGIINIFSRIALILKCVEESGHKVWRWIYRKCNHRYSPGSLYKTP